jgi:hypothetical protein
MKLAYVFGVGLLTTVKAVCGCWVGILTTKSATEFFTIEAGYIFSLLVMVAYIWSVKPSFRGLKWQLLIGSPVLFHCIVLCCVYDTSTWTYELKRAAIGFALQVSIYVVSATLWIHHTRDVVICIHTSPNEFAASFLIPTEGEARLGHSVAPEHRRTNKKTDDIEEEDFIQSA